MSELTPCNYCIFSRIKAQADKDGMRVVRKNGWAGGIDVYAIPKNANIADMGPKTRERYLKAWLKEIPDFCCC